MGAVTAIANSRLVGLANGQVSFTWKDYRQEGNTKVMTLPVEEFIRRFLQHTVPDGFHRIRHIGFLANGHRTESRIACATSPVRISISVRAVAAACCPAARFGRSRHSDRTSGATAHDAAGAEPDPLRPAGNADYGGG